MPVIVGRASGYAMTAYQDKNRIEWMRYLESFMDLSCPCVATTGA